MAILTKTTAQFVTAIEDGSIVDVLAAIKKPGADRVIMVVTVSDGSASQGAPKSNREVWDVG